MANLAIKGHPTRGRDIIQLLEMLGGRNSNNCTGQYINRIYFINKYGYIESTDDIKLQLYCATYNLEEFEEKFPYKVWDKVKCWINGYHNINTIKDILWDSIVNEVKYKIDDYWYSAINLQPYKEETMEENINEKTFPPYMDYDITTTNEEMEKTMIKIPEFPQSINLIQSNVNEIEVVLGDYEFILKDGKTYFVKKKPKYPKTYEECFNICFGNKHHIVQVGLEGLGNNKELFENFIKLKICRDAYWKIAGEQMGLSKPWESDFTNNDEERYGIYTLANKVEKDFCGVGDVNMILVFPTEEMRDAFYENFKDLIERCKELL